MQQGPAGMSQHRVQVAHADRENVACLFFDNGNCLCSLFEPQQQHASEQSSPAVPMRTSCVLV
jgi:hypothetical protein